MLSRFDSVLTPGGTTLTWPFASLAGETRSVPRADDGSRTRDLHLGKVTRYQLRYIREDGRESSMQVFRALPIELHAPKCATGLEPATASLQ